MTKIIYLIAEDWFFESHFLERALSACDAGFEVYVVTKVTREKPPEWANKISIIPVEFKRSGLNPFSEFFVLLEILKIYKNISPDVVHQVAMKPIIYGSLAAYLSRIKIKIINAPVGMGFVFTSNTIKALLLRPFVLMMLWLTLNPQDSRVIFENPDDLNQFVDRGFVDKSTAYLIQGAGVDVDKFLPKMASNPLPVITLVSRMLSDKGVLEFIGAAKIVNAKEERAVFQLVGVGDPSNPASLSDDFLSGVSGTYGIRWLGHSTDIASIYQRSDIACLPSYREGLPKSLIEAAACGLPIVTTNAVGCREVVVDGKNGLLVPVKSVQSLADTLLHLINDPQLRLSMGMVSRKLALEKFSSKIVISETLKIYN